MINFENDLNSKLGSGASPVIFEEGRRYGSNLVSQFPDNNFRKKEGLENSIEILKATGWGIGKCETDKTGIIKFSLSDPSINPRIETRSRFLVGMVQGILEKISCQNMRVIEERFDAQKNSLNFTFAKSGSNHVP